MLFGMRSLACRKISLSPRQGRHVMARHYSMAKIEKKATKRAPATIPKNPKNYVASVGKAFAVLKGFTNEAFVLTPSEIAARADLDRGTAFRLIQTLVELGYVQAV